MKKLLALTIALGMLLSCGVSFGASESRHKQDPSKLVIKKRAMKKRIATAGAVTPLQGKFDDFIDKNMNGLDDRREKLIKKAVAAASVDKKEKMEK